MARSRIQEVWPLSPLQEGLLFHALYDGQGPDVYTVQHAFGLAGPLDAEVMRAAGQALLDRHASLRASFRQPAGLGKPVQVIVREAKPSWQEADLGALGETDALAEAERLAAAERHRRFDLAVPPLLRFLLIRLSPERHRLVITSHHILIDGWSMPVLARELFAVYAAGGDAACLPPVRPYREFLGWLAAQDTGAARAAWTAELAGLDEPTLLASAAQAARVLAPPEDIHVQLAADLTAVLGEQARAARITLNTVLQGAWGLLLGRLTGRSDVAFGITVAGRPHELPGAESMLGLFINTVPVRVRTDPADLVASMLSGLQNRQSALLAYHHLGLAEIQRAAGPGAVFDTLMVYENYPVGPAGPAGGGGGNSGQLRVTGVGGLDATHYPLSLIVVPQARLRLVLGFRPDLFAREAVQAITGLAGAGAGADRRPPPVADQPGRDR